MFARQLYGTKQEKDTTPKQTELKLILLFHNYYATITRVGLGPKHQDQSTTTSPRCFCIMASSRPHNDRPTGSFPGAVLDGWSSCFSDAYLLLLALIFLSLQNKRIRNTHPQTVEFPNTETRDCKFHILKEITVTAQLCYYS